jgi:hypothetical protein
LSFAVVTDLTNDIHVGDLLELRVGTKPGVALIELKEGEVNRELGRVLESDSGLDAASLREIASRYGDKGVAQARRMERQQRRMRQVAESLDEEVGVDLRSGRSWKTTSDHFVFDTWHEEFEYAVDEARRRGSSGIQIEGALQVIAFDLRDDRAEKDMVLAKLLIHSLLTGTAGDEADPLGTATSVRDRLYPVRDLLGPSTLVNSQHLGGCHTPTLNLPSILCSDESRS